VAQQNGDGRVEFERERWKGRERMEEWEGEKERESEWSLPTTHLLVNTIGPP